MAAQLESLQRQLVEQAEQAAAQQQAAAAAQEQLSKKELELEALQKQLEVATSADGTAAVQLDERESEMKELRQDLAEVAELESQIEALQMQLAAAAAGNSSTARPGSWALDQAWIEPKYSTYTCIGQKFDDEWQRWVEGRGGCVGAHC